MINIAEILKSFSIGTILYSPICGELRLSKIISNSIFCNTDTGQDIVFMKDGTLKSYGQWGNKGECLLFPSQFMNDWEKLTWKKGDILVQGDYHCIFEEFACQNFCSFKQKYIDYKEAKDIQTTANWSKSNDENVNRQYIREIEEKYGGKLNIETLEIEKTKKCEFQPFDKVLVRDHKEDSWKIEFFSHYEGVGHPVPYACVGARYSMCIPYNDQTKHLLGTTGDWEGGEG